MKLRFFTLYLLIFYVAVILTTNANGDVIVPLQVKEVAGVGSDGFPITVVVPLPRSKYYNVNTFQVVDSSGSAVPAQFNVLNRWWALDSSIRHVKVHFQPSVSAFSTSGTGISTYYLRDDGIGNNISTSLNVNDLGTSIEVVTGPLKFIVNKNQFKIIDELWLDSNNNGSFEVSEKMITQGVDGGASLTNYLNEIQKDSERTDVNFVIEEAGPMQVVIRAEALTNYVSTTDHTHGFAVRIYAYADKPYVKIDYQLQNSAKNVRHAWALYFEEMGINYNLNLTGNPTVRVGSGDGSVYTRTRDGGLYLAQESHGTSKVYDVQTNNVLKTTTQTDSNLASNPVREGFIDVSDTSKGVSAMTRYFWQTWPNGLAINNNNKLSFELYPEWSAQQSYINGISSSGLYLFEDMQQAYKETMLYFHDSTSTDNELISLSKTFNYHPVATIPTSWYQQTSATLDKGGLIPISNKVSATDERLYKYSTSDFRSDSEANYRFNWDNFYLIDKSRKEYPAQGGGWPKSSAKIIATENPEDYYFAEQYIMGEINTRPHWIAGYNFADDYDLLKLNFNTDIWDRPSWRNMRSQIGSDFETRYMDAAFLSGTYKDATPRDNAHAWYYHVEEAYYVTGNPWIKDWYNFIAEIRKGKLFDYGNNHEISTRAKGHSLANAIQAYRITGDNSLIDGAQNLIKNRFIEKQHPYYGMMYYHQPGKGSHYAESGMQVGYLINGIIGYMEEVKDADWQKYAEAFQFVSGYMEWNYNLANFDYEYHDYTTGVIGSSRYNSFTLIDSQAWYYLHTGKQKYLDHLNEYMDVGINGGEKPTAGNPYFWSGQWEGRISHFVRNNVKSDTLPPPKITNLAAARTGSNTVRLVFTVPSDAYRYHIVYSEKPISEDMTQDTSFTNWWAAEVVGIDPSLVNSPGQEQNLIVQADQNIALYVSMFTFDGNDNMSAMSNVSPVLDLIDQTEPSVPQGLSANMLSDFRVELTWQSSTDYESGISKYIIYRNDSKVGESNTTSFIDTGLSEITTYSYTVSAVNKAGLESDRSASDLATTLADTTSPTLVSVESTGNPAQVRVTFSEPVDKASAENISNYSIDNNIGVLSALLGSDLITVTLTTTLHAEGINYTLNVNNIEDKAYIPNKIAPNTGATYSFILQLVITDLNAVSGLTYEVLKNGLQIGATTYIDRDYTFTSIPSSLLGVTYIKTANDDKDLSGDSFLVFTVNQDMTLYIAHDDRILAKPSWLASYTDTGGNIVNTDSTFSLFSKDFPAGLVSIGGNDGSGTSSMYTVIVVQRGSGLSIDLSPPSPPVGLRIIR